MDSVADIYVVGPSACNCRLDSSFQIPALGVNRLLDAKGALALIGPLLGVVIGWGLKEISEMIRTRREDRKVIGKALADLLEIRHRVVAIPHAMKEITNRLGFPPEFQAVIGVFLSKIAPIEAISKRYDDSVNLIAAADPLLAFRLRYKDIASALVEQLRMSAVGQPASAPDWIKVETMLLGNIGPELDKVVLELAWLHSVWTWFKTRRRLRRPIEVSGPILDSIIATVQEMAAKESAARNSESSAARQAASGA